MQSIDQQSSNGNPESPQRPIVGSDNDNGGDDGGSPKSPVAPPPLSRFALRDDGVLLVSLEDAVNRDTTGREVIAFLVLTSDEAAHARASANHASSSAAAQIIDRLPMRPR